MTTLTQPAASNRFRIAGLALAALVLATVGGMKLAQTRARAAEAGQRRTEVEAGPRVRVLVAGGDASGAALAFQGEAVPVANTTVYAKIGGFIKAIPVDKGSRVRKGDVLCILESPETDQLTLALKATYENLQRTADRMKELGRQGIANAQDVDNSAASAEVARKNLEAQRLSQGYERVLAPFSGVVTARLVDVGAFIQNASSSTASQPIVSLADASHLRIDFFLDQASAALVKVGQDVEVSPVDRPDLVRKAKVDRVAGTLDARTRTMLAEADLDNRDGAILGGGYVRVALRLAKAGGQVEIPSEALLVRGTKPYVASLENDRVKMLPVILGADIGSRVRVPQGLAPGTRIILNPDPGLKDGDRVQVMK